MSNSEDNYALSGTHSLFEHGYIYTLTICGSIFLVAIPIAFGSMVLKGSHKFLPVVLKLTLVGFFV